MIGNKINLVSKLFPINRSLTGEGVRETLKIISSHIPNLKIKSVPSGTKVLIGVFQKNGLVKEAYIITPSGKKYVIIIKIIYI